MQVGYSAGRQTPVTSKCLKLCKFQELIFDDRSKWMNACATTAIADLKESCDFCLSFILTEATRHKCSTQILMYTAYPINNIISTMRTCRRYLPNFAFMTLTHSTRTVAQTSNQFRSNQEAVCASTRRWKNIQNLTTGNRVRPSKRKAVLSETDQRTLASSLKLGHDENV